jgi:hypothetical protein
MGFIMPLHESNMERKIKDQKEKETKGEREKEAIFLHQSTSLTLFCFLVT